MNKLKVLFVGIGSIAKRHISNLIYVCSQRGIDVEINALRHCYAASDSHIEGINHTYHNVNDITSDYDVIFITNPTEYHIDSLRELHCKSNHFFIEKPIVSMPRLDEAKNFDYRNESVYYVACPLRYTGVLQYVKRHIPVDLILGVRAICSSYLPEWRPGTDYRECYSARRELGGGVHIDLIHEWDYLIWLFGRPDEVHYIGGKASELEIDSDDYAIYIAKCGKTSIEIHLDYYGREAMRTLLLFTNDDTIEVDLINSKVRYLKSGETIEIGEQRNDYCRQELSHFLDIIDGTCRNDSDPIHACKVMDITEGRL